MPITFFDNSKLPQRLYDKISDEIFKYSISIVGLRENNDDIIGGLLGSGTLVKYKNKKGILTAKHVVNSDAFKKSVYIGFNYESHAHSPKVFREYLAIDKPRDNNADFAFINLPITDLGWIEAKREFWNLEKYFKKVLECKYINDGLWIVSGAIDEYTEEEINEDRYKKVYRIKCFAWPSEFEKEFEWEEHDEIDVFIEYLTDGHLPSSFGGTSGGSLWQVPLSLKGNTIFKIKDLLFTGIPYYQEVINKNKIRIKCEGRKSIYRSLIELFNLKMEA